jgi:hypothetical protein
MSDYIQNFRQGNTKVIKIDYGKGVDVTGWKYYFTLKNEIDDVTNVHQTMTTAGDNALDDINNGLAFLTVDSTASALIPVGKYFWSIVVDKGGSPPVITTILPPIDDWKDKLEIVQAIKL